MEQEVNGNVGNENSDDRYVFCDGSQCIFLSERGDPRSIYGLFSEKIIDRGGTLKGFLLFLQERDTFDWGSLEWGEVQTHS